MLGSIMMEKPFNIDEVLNKLPDAEPLLKWAKIKLPPNNNHVTIYKTGKVLIYGTTSEKELISLSNGFVNYLRKNGINNNIKDIEVKNYVIIDQLGFNINLENLSINLKEYNDVLYEPEQFPALKFKDNHNITYLLFRNGKLTIVGVKSLDHLEEYINEFKELIRENQ